MKPRFTSILVVAALTTVVGASALAETPRTNTLEIRTGPYTPEIDTGFQTAKPYADVFGSDGEFISADDFALLGGDAQSTLQRQGFDFGDSTSTATGERLTDGADTLPGDNAASQRGNRPAGERGNDRQTQKEPQPGGGHHYGRLERSLNLPSGSLTGGRLVAGWNLWRDQVVDDWAPQVQFEDGANKDASAEEPPAAKRARGQSAVPNESATA